MDTRLMQTMFAQRAAASHAVAGALAPRSTSSTARGTVPTPGSTATGTATASGSTSTGAANASSTITSSDFLTLLVSELQNQDPTQPTDPNAYITQLAQVNSLEQLISINSGIQQLDSAVPASGSASGGGTGGSTGSTASADPQPATSSVASSQVHRQVHSQVPEAATQ